MGGLDEMAVGLDRLLGAGSLGTAIGATSVIATTAPMGGGGGGGGQVGCFAAGTMILTADGERAVETLVEGDVLLTTSGERAPLVWVGRRTIKTARVTNRLQVLPVRIRAGAFAEGVPCRDLFVSSDHALLLQGVLVPAVKLINGGTVVQVEVDEVTYFHLECERHVVLVADGAAAESYLDAGNRVFFANAPGSVALQPQLPTPGVRDSLAAPWATRDQVAAVRQANLERGEALGYRVRLGDAAGQDACKPRRIA